MSKKNKIIPMPLNIKQWLKNQKPENRKFLGNPRKEKFEYLYGDVVLINLTKHPVIMADLDPESVDEKGIPNDTPTVILKSLFPLTFQFNQTRYTYGNLFLYTHYEYSYEEELGYIYRKLKSILPDKVIKNYIIFFIVPKFLHSEYRKEAEEFFKDVFKMRVKFVSIIRASKRTVRFNLACKRHWYMQPDSPFNFVNKNEKQEVKLF